MTALIQCINEENETCFEILMYIDKIRDSSIKWYLTDRDGMTYSYYKDDVTEIKLRD